MHSQHLLAAVLLAVAVLALPLAASSAAAENPRVVLDTTKGSIVLELAADEAPETVSNFLAYTESGFYDGTIFHRVIPGFMIQGGGFTPDLVKKPTRDPIRNEASSGLKNARGTIAMARTSDPHSATAQFFINTADNASLDHTAETRAGWGYTAFGRVVEGMDIVDAISAVATGVQKRMRDVPKEAVVIRSVKVAEAAEATGTAETTETE